MASSDGELIAACRRGEADAWQELVLRYQRLIYTIPIRAGLDEPTAAEVFQHVFVALYQNIPAIERPDRIRSWLVTTTKRETLRVLRRAAAGYADVSTDDQAAQDLPDAGPLPAEQLQRLEEQHMVRDAVQRLADPCRALLTMLFYQETPLPYADVAAALGMPTGSIGPTRARCLQKLRAVLVEMGF